MSAFVGYNSFVDILIFAMPVDVADVIFYMLNDWTNFTKRIIKIVQIVVVILCCLSIPIKCMTSLKPAFARNLLLYQCNFKSGSIFTLMKIKITIYRSYVCQDYSCTTRGRVLK